MKIFFHYPRFAQLLFGMSLLFFVVTHCVDLDNYIHIDYIKKKYPEVEVELLKAQAMSDGAIASAATSIDNKSLLKILLGSTFTLMMINFFSENSSKIEGWLQAISPKYPASISADRGGNSITFGVPYYFFIPYTALICWAAKR